MRQGQLALLHVQLALPALRVAGWEEEEEEGGKSAFRFGTLLFGFFVKRLFFRGLFSGRGNGRVCVSEGDARVSRASCSWVRVALHKAP
jgi:hypothetical protein